MRSNGLRRFVWCGGGSTLVPRDRITFGARFVEFFARTFMGLRHRDKVHQWALLTETEDLDWLALVPALATRLPTPEEGPATHHRILVQEVFPNVKGA